MGDERERRGSEGGRMGVRGFLRVGWWGGWKGVDGKGYGV